MVNTACLIMSQSKKVSTNLLSTKLTVEVTIFFLPLCQSSCFVYKTNTKLEGAADIEKKMVNSISDFCFAIFFDSDIFVIVIIVKRGQLHQHISVEKQNFCLLHDSCISYNLRNIYNHGYYITYEWTQNLTRSKNVIKKFFL